MTGDPVWAKGREQRDGELFRHQLCKVNSNQCYLGNVNINTDIEFIIKQLNQELIVYQAAEVTLPIHILPEIGSRTCPPPPLQIPKSTDAQVLYIKRPSIYMQPTPPHCVFEIISRLLEIPNIMYMLCKLLL